MGSTLNFSLSELILDNFQDNDPRTDDGITPISLTVHHIRDIMKDLGRFQLEPCTNQLKMCEMLLNKGKEKYPWDHEVNMIFDYTDKKGHRHICTIIMVD